MIAFGPPEGDVWLPSGVQIFIDLIGNGPINDALLQGAHDSRRRARALIKVRGGGLSLEESIFT